MDLVDKEGQLIVHTDHVYYMGNVDRYINRYIGRHSIDTRFPLGRLSIDSRSTLNQDAVDGQLIVGRHSFSGHRYLADTWPILDLYLIDA